VGRPCRTRVSGTCARSIAHAATSPVVARGAAAEGARFRGKAGLPTRFAPCRRGFTGSSHVPLTPATSTSITSGKHSAFQVSFLWPLPAPHRPLRRATCQSLKSNWYSPESSERNALIAGPADIPKESGNKVCS
jgi:hypothetical protein